MICPIIGAHVSVAGGLYNAVANAENIGAECAQIFGASPRQWSAKMPKKEDVERLMTAQKEKSFGPIYLHAAYLVNLATPKRDLLGKSIENLTNHLAIAAAIEAEGLIFHAGSGKGMERKEALDQEVRAMKKIIKNVPGNSQLIIENTAGGGERIGDIDDVKYLFKKVNSNRVKVCIDTAHAFESGLIEKYTPQNIKKFVDLWDKAVGIKNIVALHANDSKTEAGSRHDRHENIGEGHIGMEGFKALAREKRLHDKVWILEVPGFDNNGPDKKNINILKSCFV
jgi:deoxyribonuclease IV